MAWKICVFLTSRSVSFATGVGQLSRLQRKLGPLATKFEKRLGVFLIQHSATVESDHANVASILATDRRAGVMLLQKFEPSSAAQSSSLGNDKVLVGVVRKIDKPRKG